MVRFGYRMGRLSNPFGSVVSPYEEWRDLEGSLRNKFLRLPSSHSSNGVIYLR